MACTCQNCGRKYKVDLVVSSEIWEKITPKPDQPGAGMLCGPCIMERVETLGEYGCLQCDAGYVGVLELSLENACDNLYGGVVPGNKATMFTPGEYKLQARAELAREGSDVKR